MNGNAKWLKAAGTIAGLIAAILTTIGILWASSLKPQVEMIAIEEAEKRVRVEAATREKEDKEIEERIKEDLSEIKEGQRRLEEKLDRALRR